MGLQPSSWTLYCIASLRIMPARLLCLQAAEMMQKYVRLNIHCARAGSPVLWGDSVHGGGALHHAWTAQCHRLTGLNHSVCSRWGSLTAHVPQHVWLSCCSVTLSTHCL